VTESGSESKIREKGLSVYISLSLYLYISIYSILALSYFMCSAALESSDVLQSHFVVSLAYHITFNNYTDIYPLLNINININIYKHI